MKQPTRSSPASAQVAEPGNHGPGKKRRRPEQLATRSSMALEAMCFAIVRRLPGMSRVKGVEVLQVMGDAEEGNWRSGKVDIDPPLDQADRQRVEAALKSWRHRFRLAAAS
jgi:hypothetical protein